MNFPLGLLIGWCEEHGFPVLHDPGHHQDSFSWITAHKLLEGPATTQPSVENALGPLMDGCIVRIESRDLTDNTSTDGECEPCLVLRHERDHTIHVACDLSPHEFAELLQRYLMGIVSWNDRLTNLLDSGCQSQDLLEASEPVLGSYLGLSDASYAYIAHTVHIAPIDSESCYFVKYHHYSPSLIEKTIDLGLYRAWKMSLSSGMRNADGGTNTDGMRRHRSLGHCVELPLDDASQPYSINQVIRKNGSYAAHLLMVSKMPIRANRVFLFKLLARKIELCLLHHWDIENPLEQRYTYFLKELYAGNTYDAHRLKEHAALHHIPTEGCFEVLIAESGSQKLSAHYFATLLMNSIPSCKVTMENGTAIVLLCSQQGDKHGLSAIETQLVKHAHSLRLEVGVSDVFYSIGDASLALEKARVALTYGRRLSRRYGAFHSTGGHFEDATDHMNGIHRFRRYFPHYVVDPYSRSGKFVAKLLSSPNPLQLLRAHDRRHGTADYEVLRVYLRYEGRHHAVCDTLHMHRNTLAYRLAKIREVTDTDIENPDERMFLRMLYLLQG